MDFTEPGLSEGDTVVAECCIGMCQVFIGLLLASLQSLPVRPAKIAV